MRRLLTPSILSSLVALACGGAPAANVPQSPTAAPPVRGTPEVALSAKGEAPPPQPPGCALKGAPLAGSTRQGGYALAYESWQGESQPNRGCIRYGLRNEPGELYTPALWKDDKEVFIDTGLPECPKGAECPWVYVVKLRLAVADGKSTLSYGVNQNEYEDSPLAFKAHDTLAAASLGGAEPPALVTQVWGVIADAGGRPLGVGFRVSSYLSRGGGAPHRLTYRIETASQSAPLVLAQTRGLSERELSLDWESAASPAFHARLKEQVTAQATAGPLAQEVQLSAGAVEVAEGLLTLTQGGRRIFSTGAPAYRPKE